MELVDGKRLLELDSLLGVEDRARAIGFEVDDDDPITSERARGLTVGEGDIKQAFDNVILPVPRCQVASTRSLPVTPRVRMSSAWWQWTIAATPVVTVVRCAEELGAVGFDERE